MEITRYVTEIKMLEVISMTPTFTASYRCPNDYWKGYYTYYSSEGMHGVRNPECNGAVRDCAAMTAPLFGLTTKC